MPRFPLRVMLPLLVSCGEGEIDDGLVAPALEVETQTLAAGKIGEAYVADLSARGGVPPYRWALASGELPLGMVLDGASIVGRPEEGGRFAIVVSVTDSTLERAFAALVLRIAATEEPPSGTGTCDAPYRVDLSSGSAIVAGDFGGLEDNAQTVCGSYPASEAVFAIELAEPADLRITSMSFGGGFVYEMRADRCSGTELGCAAYDPLHLPSLGPGTYYLLIERQRSEVSSYSLTVEQFPATPRPTNDTCINAEPITFAGDTAVVDAVLTAAVPGSSPGSCTEARALYYSVTLTRPSHLMVHTDNSNLDLEVLQGSCGALSSLGCGDFGGVCTDEVLAPGTYLVAVSTDELPPIAGQVAISRIEPATLPANDACVQAEELRLAPGGSASAAGTMAGATDDVALLSPSCPQMTGAPEVFYVLDLPQISDVVIQLSALTANYLQVALIEGGCASGSVPHCVDRYDPGWIRYNVPAGPLGIVVERVRDPFPDECEELGYDDFQLSISVSPSPPVPPNDLCTSSEPITLAAVGSMVTVAGTTRGANDEVTTLECAGGGSYETLAPDVFYRIDLGANGRLRLTPTASSDLLLSLYGTACGATGALACGDPSLDTLSQIPAGTYYLRVDHDSRFGSSVPADFLLLAELLP